MKTSELIREVKEVIYRARYLFILSLALSLYISLRFDFLTGIIIHTVLNIFAGVIGSNDILIDNIARAYKGSKKINELHFNQLVIDTEKLTIIANMIRTGLSESEESTKIYNHLDKMVKENIETINSIKLAMNRGSL